MVSAYRPTVDAVAVHYAAIRSDVIVIGVAALLFRYAWEWDATPALEADAARAAWSVAQALFATSMLYADLFHNPIPGDPRVPGNPHPDDTKYLISRGPLGHLAYFTIQTLWITTLHHVLSAAAEVALLLGHPLHAVSRMCYGTGVWVGVDGCVLTVLFLGMNWYDPQYQKDIRRTWQTIWSPWFPFLSLYTHIFTLPLAFADILFAKDEALLRALTPANDSLMRSYVTYIAFYTACTYLTRKATGAYPYSIFDHLDKLAPGGVPLGWILFDAAQAVLIGAIANGCVRLWLPGLF